MNTLLIILHVIEPTSVIGLTLNDTCLKEGSTVSIRCHVGGFPRPNIDFRRNDIIIDPRSPGFDNYMMDFFDEVIIYIIDHRPAFQHC